MRNCRQCGFPLKFARYFDWRSDGTIISTDRTKTRSRIVFLGDGNLEKLFKDLSGTIGTPVDRFIIQAQKQIGKAILSNLPLRHVRRLPANRYLRSQGLARLLVRLVAGDFAGLGDGRVSLLEYRAGESMVLQIRNPCLIPMLVGSATGIYESIEDMPVADYDYRLEGDSLIITMKHGTDSPASLERLYLEEPVLSSGPLVYQRCPACDVPLDVARTLEWDIDRGVIHNRGLGRREVIVSVQSVNAMLRELEYELGEEISRLLYDHQKEITVSDLGNNHAPEGSFWDSYLESLALKGLGYPSSIHTEEDRVDLAIDNPYNRILYAAKVAAGLELVSGRVSEIEWHHSIPGAACFTVRV